MSKVYYYFNNVNYPINVTKETTELTSYTFSPDGTLWEVNELTNFFSMIDKDKSFNIVDVGAQSGLYTLFSKYLPNSTFYAFEPFPDSFRLLNDNIKLNEITNVKTFELGLSNEKKETSFSVCVSHNGLHTISDTPLRFTADDTKTISINVDTIDNLFYEKDIPVHFIKIDTEGWEYFVLQGAIKTIQKYKPIIQMEWFKDNMEQCKITEREMHEFLISIGYHITPETRGNKSAEVIIKPNVKVN